MENQHRLIPGYRDLTPREIELMAQIKLHAEQTAAIVALVKTHLREQRVAAQPLELNPAELKRIDAAEPERWVAIARTELQEGFMALARAVAQPTTF